MARNVAETLIGALVLIVAIGFVAFAYTKTDMRSVDGYEVTAQFADLGGLAEGADVRISGIKIGSVVDLSLDLETYFAKITMAIDDSVQLPADTTAQVATQGLLGGNYIKLEPGGDESMISSGGAITYTQDAADIIGLLLQLVFSNKPE